MTLFSRQPCEWRLLARAVLTLSWAVAATRALPYRAWRGLGTRRTSERPEGNAVSPVMIVRAIDGASRIVPGGGNCLARALAGRALMARHGLSSEIVLGVAKAPDGWLRSHAWLQYKGNALLGEQGVSGFSPMPDLADRL